jgi:NADH-quinone oxidoreductase E subunit
VVVQTEADIEPVDEILRTFPRSEQYLIPVLQRVQDELGYLPPEALEKVAKHLRMSRSQVYGVVTFYAQFRFTPRGRHVVKICRGTACHVRGGASLREAVERELGVKPGETTPDLKFTFEAIACFGACALAPVVIIDSDVHGHVSQDKLRRLLAEVA